MTKVLFLSYSQEENGVREFGKLIFSALAPSRRYSFLYREVSNPEDISRAAAELEPTAILINRRLSTICPLSRSLFWTLGIPVVGIIPGMTVVAEEKAKEVDLDFYIAHDPFPISAVPNCFRSARPTPGSSVLASPPATLTIGSLAFSISSADFEGLVARTNAEFDNCVVRICIPNSILDHPEGATVGSLLDRCRRLITKPGIELSIIARPMSLNDVLLFLAENSLNVFFANEHHLEAAHTEIDCAIEVGCPIALRVGSSFRRLFDGSPSIFVEDRSLSDILAEGTASTAVFKQQWSQGQVLTDYEAALTEILQQWSSFSANDLRGQWTRRVRILNAESERAATADEARINEMALSLIALQQHVCSADSARISAEKRLLQAQSDIERLRGRTEALKRKKRKVKESLSWRATKPLRWAIKLYRRSQKSNMPS